MKRRAPDDPGSSQSAYLRAVRWLTARELSERQVRARLSETGFQDEAISTAIGRLLDERIIDDRRAAVAIARTEARVRRHGSRRILGKLASMQFDRDLAREVVSELFNDHDELELMEAALDRRLHSKWERLDDPQERRRIHAYLVRQGFSPSAATHALRKNRRDKSQ